MEHLTISFSEVEVAPTFPHDTYCNFCGKTPGKNDVLNKTTADARICDECLMQEILYHRCLYYQTGIA